jgi:hypothetical protein
VFSFLSPLALLSRMPRVCSEWKRLAQDPILWRDIHARHFGHEERAQPVGRSDHTVGCVKNSTPWRDKSVEALKVLTSRHQAYCHIVERDKEEFKLRVWKDRTAYRRDLVMHIASLGLPLLLRNHLETWKGEQQQQQAHLRTATQLRPCPIKPNELVGPLSEAVRRGHWRSAQVLLAYGAELGPSFFMAVVSKDRRMTFDLLRLAVEGEERERKIEAGISLAALNRDKDMVRMLVMLHPNLTIERIRELVMPGERALRPDLVDSDSEDEDSEGEEEGGRGR